MDVLSVQLANGLGADARRLSLAANNLANETATGYQAVAADPTPGPAVAAGARPAKSPLNPNVQVLMSGLVYTQRSTASGPLRATGTPTHMALSGSGYFVVKKGGVNMLTRSGAFSLDASGRLALSSGALLLGQSGRPLTVPKGSQGLQVGPDGTVSVTEPSGRTAIGKVWVAAVPNPQGLSAQGGTLLLPTAASGPMRTVSLGAASRIYGGMLEGSNVDLAQALVHTTDAANAFSMKARLLALDSKMQNRLDQLA